MTRGGKAGDQTGRETCIRSLYNKPWDMCIRYKDSKVAAKAAEIGKKLANSKAGKFVSSGINEIKKEFSEQLKSKTKENDEEEKQAKEKAKMEQNEAKAVPSPVLTYADINTLFVIALACPNLYKS